MKRDGSKNGQQAGASVSRDVLRYGGDVESLRVFVGVSGRVLDAGRGVAVLEVDGGPLTAVAGCEIVKDQRGRISVRQNEQTDDE